MAMILQPMPEPNIVIIEPEPTIIQSVIQPAVIQPVLQPAVIQPVVQAPPVTVVQQVPTTVVVQPRLGEDPGRTRCHYCQQEIVTVTKPIMGTLTWTIFGVLFALCIWPFCLIPFCVPACKDIEHSCPSCHNIISVHRRM
ncbi:LITAF domain-containing protein-like [Hoplias malabaricus]|uniref:LITAF domain-containing protein-like n=1 Tax=Hoplias malabaricus TaxID=27720 RepID=UPI0034624542